MKRRDFLAGGMALAATLPAGVAAAAMPPGLATHARAKGRYFGAAVKSRQLREDARTDEEGPGLRLIAVIGAA